ncbi:hypothetical protein D9758_004907 [Tetrapyrgos nigripes]|uniref:Up-regulated during septation protein 1 domain-containing protein n=1 Tax=Tetrapyrgos nigripes TaxID=182062 RepID=A0A8H5G691_9AGAR|nr:hypothetical protein D9758_004907 [Tetrapyrgos nigripes]
MNGVRRFLGAAASVTSSSPPEPAPQPIPVQADSIPPLNSRSGPSWPPQSPPQQQPPSPFGSPKTTTAALFLLVRRSPAQHLLHTGKNQSSSSIGSSPITRKQPSLPVAGPSSPQTPSKMMTRKPVSPLEPGSQRASGLLNTRDELLLSLLASEAVVDSRDFEILSSEEVEELKKEQQLLSARIGAVTKKLNLETKIRDAAASLSKVNAPHKKVSKQTEEQLETANRRVDAAQKDLWKISERSAEVYRRLVEHRAGVLSYSVRSMEKKIAPQANGTNGYTNGTMYGSDVDSGYGSTPMSPASSSSTIPGSTVSSKSRFDGAHLFAGHADSIVPTRLRSPEDAAAEIASLERKFKAATESLTVAGKKQAELARDLQLLRLEKEEAVTMMQMDLQTAEETIEALERELPKLEGLDEELEQLKEKQAVWEQDQGRLKEREKEVEDLQRKLEMLEVSQAEKVGADTLLADVRETNRQQLEKKDEEIRRMKAEWEVQRQEWENERQQMEDDRMTDLERLQEEVDKAREDEEILLRNTNKELDDASAGLRSIAQKYRISIYSQDSSLRGLIAALDHHLESRVRAESEAEALKTKLEEDVKNGLDKREALSRDLEDARREREEARKEARALETRLKDEPNFPVQSVAFPFPPETQYTGDAASIVTVLQPLWNALPSPETRAARFATQQQRGLRGSGSPTLSPKDLNTAKSLAELDVRSLKILYENRPSHPGTPNTPNPMPFSIENFVQRVQALIADDKALIERLLRFAQAHDLLRKNADRAQKLAQESNLALETYQKQVRTLEERNASLAAKPTLLQEEMARLQETVERLTAEKSEIETQAAAQAETCLQLTDANNTLSGQVLTLADEGAKAQDALKQQLEAQLSEVQKKLNLAQEEIDDMRSSESSQRIALLDELNTMQTENGQLRAQIRALKK